MRSRLIVATLALVGAVGLGACGSGSSGSSSNSTILPLTPTNFATIPTVPATTTTTVAPAPGASIAGESTYVIVAGDYPSTIARQFGVKFQDLLTLNGWTLSGDQVTNFPAVGTEIKIPAGAVQPDTATATTTAAATATTAAGGSQGDHHDGGGLVEVDDHDDEEGRHHHDGRRLDADELGRAVRRGHLHDPEGRHPDQRRQELRPHRRPAQRGQRQHQGLQVVRRRAEDRHPQGLELPVAPMLSIVEGRVIGCLLEKERTVPDQYPLSVNALVAACNQSTAREPVMHLAEHEVLDALTSLKTAGVVRFVHPSHGRSVTRYRQVFDEHLGLERPGAALIALLLLRGPQTAAELQARAGRLADFGSAADAEAALALARPA